MKNEVLVKYSAFLMSLLIGEMVAGNWLPLYAVRFFYPLLIVSIYTRKFTLIKGSILYYISILIFLIYSIFDIGNPLIKAEVINIVWWLTFSFILNSILENKNDFYLFRLHLFRWVFVLTFIGSIVGIYKFYQLTNGIVWKSMIFIGDKGFETFIPGTSLNADYNIYSFGIFFGILSGWYLYLIEKVNRNKVFISIAMLIMNASALLSSSRRGFVVGLILLGLFMIINLKKRFTTKQEGKKNALPWLSILTILFVFIFVTKISIDTVSNNSNEIKQVVDRINTVGEINEREQDTRTPRWEYAFNLFLEHNIPQQLFGKGFYYIELIGNQFGEAKYDHPHNVYISALLYSGVVGLILLLISTFEAFKLYFSYRKVIGIMGVWFLLMLILNFSSSNSIFSTRIGVVLFSFANFNIFKK